jgi:hypothetical protein
VVAKRMATYAEAILARDEGHRREGRQKGLSVTFEGKNAPAWRADLRSRAGRRRATAELGDSRPRQDKGEGEPAGFHRSGRAAAHAEPTIFRHRRCRGRSDARAQGLARGARGGRGDSRQGRGLRASRIPGRGLHRSRARLDRADETEAKSRTSPSRSQSIPGRHRAVRRRSTGRMD